MGCYYASHTPQIWSALTYKACLCKKNIMYINIIASDNNFPPKKVQVIITNNTKKRYLSNYKIHIHICQKPTMGLEKPNFESLRTIWILAKHTLTNMQSSKRTDSKLEIQRKTRTGRDKDSLKNMEKKIDNNKNWNFCKVISDEFFLQKFRKDNMLYEFNFWVSIG